MILFKNCKNKLPISRLTLIASDLKNRRKSIGLRKRKLLMRVRSRISKTSWRCWRDSPGTSWTNCKKKSESWPRIMNERLQKWSKTTKTRGKRWTSFSKTKRMPWLRITKRDCAILRPKWRQSSSRCKTTSMRKSASWRTFSRGREQICRATRSKWESRCKPKSTSSSRSSRREPDSSRSPPTPFWRGTRRFRSCETKSNSI